MSIPATPSATTPVGLASPQRSWWGDRSVKKKVFSVVSVTAVVAGGIGLLGISSLSTAAVRADSLYETNFKGALDVAVMDGLLGDLRQTARDAVLAPTPELTAQRYVLLEQFGQEFKDSLKAYGASSGDPEKVATAEELSADIDVYMGLQNDVLRPFAMANDAASWIAQDDAQVAGLVNDMTADVANLMEQERAQAEAAAAGIKADYQSTRLLALVIIGAGTGLALALGLAVALGIARSTRRVQDVTTVLAAGDLTKTSGLTTRDELGPMGGSLDEAVATPRELMASAVSSADPVAASSEELSASAAQISASAEETSADTGVVAGAADEVPLNVQTVAPGAKQMGASIREISQNAPEPARVAPQAVTEAEATTATTTATVTKLGDSSKEIGDLIKVITSIPRNRAIHWP
ncbi:MAG: methyl-accepting chemotaxis protein [Actinomycetota bacterium]|nr:methyl-accepting chemotaxis protein [Actinomycetota bacterium]